MVLALVCWYPVGIFCTVGFGRISFLKFMGTLFLRKIRGKPFFPQKGGWVLQKGSKAPLFGGKKGLLPKFWYQNVPTKISFGIGMVNTGKIPTETNQIYQIGKQLYKKMDFFSTPQTSLQAASWKPKKWSWYLQNWGTKIHTKDSILSLRWCFLLKRWDSFADPHQC